MVPALILVLAAWCPITTTTTTDEPRCAATATTTVPAETPTTLAPTTTTTIPAMVIEPAHPAPPEETTTTTAAPFVADAAHATRHQPRLPVTGPRSDELVVAGTLLFLGGLFVAATRTGKHP